MSEALTLPLWKACVEQMLADGATYGSTYPVEFFTKALRCEADSMEFGLAITQIRRVLEAKGMFITTRGQRGEQLVIVPASANCDVMQCYSRKAVDALKRGVILGTNTRIDLLSADDRRRHEAVLEKMAMRLALVTKRNPAALMPKKETKRLK